MIEDMTIKEANDKIKHLENLRKLKEAERDLVFERTQPKAVNTTKTIVQGGTREDKYINYMIELEDFRYQKLCDDIILLEKETNSLSDYVENELKIIGEYEPLKAKIIKLRHDGKTWEQLFDLIQGQYSISQCRRIYKSYIQRRYLDE